LSQGIITEQTEVYSLGVLFVELLNIPNQLQWVDRKALKIIDKATARNPEDRFINVKAMREELNKLIEF
jgi:hypothetical protein